MKFNFLQHVEAFADEVNFTVVVLMLPEKDPEYCEYCQQTQTSSNSIIIVPSSPTGISHVKPTRGMICVCEKFLPKLKVTDPNIVQKRSFCLNYLWLGLCSLQKQNFNGD